MFCMIMQNVYNVNKEILHFYISFTFITFSTKKLDNRNQVKIQKNINDFSWFLLHAENP